MAKPSGFQQEASETGNCFHSLCLISLRRSEVPGFIMGAGPLNRKRGLIKIIRQIHNTSYSISWWWHHIFRLIRHMCWACCVRNEKDVDLKPDLQTKVTELNCTWFEALPSHWGPPARAVASLGFCGSYSEIGNTCRRIYWMLKVKLSSPFAEGYCGISARKITSKQPCPLERELWWTRVQEIFQLLLKKK